MLRDRVSDPSLILLPDTTPQLQQRPSMPPVRPQIALGPMLNVSAEY
ncbi:hypothetical protein OG896_40300 [Streptomyces sp. NBC_00669]|nr:hypothetical protein [Streptomyces sp. NBC_00669]